MLNANIPLKIKMAEHSKTCVFVTCLCIVLVSHIPTSLNGLFKLSLSYSQKYYCSLCLIYQDIFNNNVWSLPPLSPNP